MSHSITRQKCHLWLSIGHLFMIFIYTISWFHCGSISLERFYPKARHCEREWSKPGPLEGDYFWIFHVAQANLMIGSQHLSDTNPLVCFSHVRNDGLLRIEKLLSPTSDQDAFWNKYALVWCQGVSFLTVSGCLFGNGACWIISLCLWIRRMINSSFLYQALTEPSKCLCIVMYILGLTQEPHTFSIWYVFVANEKVQSFWTCLLYSKHKIWFKSMSLIGRCADSGFCAGFSKNSSIA